jgi:cytochrome c-type biogenesis protein CcmH/NrfG
VNADPLWLLRTADAADANSVFRAAATAVRHGFAEEALPLARIGTRNHPHDARLWQVLGLAHRRLEDLAPAVEALRKAAALAPNDALIAHTLARATMEAGLPATALFETAHRLAPGDGSVLQGRAAAQFADGDLEGAIAGIEDQLARQPGWIEGHDVSARLRWARGDGDAFTQSYERALAAAPRDSALWRALVDTRMQAGHHEAALQAIARGRAAAGESPYFAALEAVCVAEQGETAEADRLFAALGGIEHITMAARYMRHLLRAGRPVEAAAYADSWSGRDPDHLLVPYQSAAWRLTGDPRWTWLEGDERLVSIHDLTGKLPPLDTLAETLRGLHLSRHHPLEQSLRGGTQTDGPLFSRIEPEIRALRQAVVEAVEAHVAQLPPPIDGHPTLLAKRAPIRFAGSWSVRLTDAGFHVNHVHPAGWLSSALYVALPEAIGSGEQGWLKLGEPQAELGLDLAPFRTIEPKPGRLVLFPTTMWHGTIPFEAGERLTVAFDVARPQ